MVFVIQIHVMFFDLEGAVVLLLVGSTGGLDCERPSPQGLAAHLLYCTATVHHVLHCAVLNCLVQHCTAL